MSQSRKASVTRPPHAHTFHRSFFLCFRVIFSPHSSSGLILSHSAPTLPIATMTIATPPIAMAASTQTTIIQPSAKDKTPRQLGAASVAGAVIPDASSGW